MRAFSFIIILVLAMSCKTHAPIVRTVTNTDTVFLERIETIRVPVESKVIIKDPCDSLGVLIPFKQTLKVDDTDVVVQNTEGAIDIYIKLDSLKQVMEKERKKSQTETIIEIPVEVPTPFLPKIFWYSIGLNILLLIYLLRGFIPFLKFIP